MPVAIPDSLYKNSYPTIEQITRNKLLDAGIRCIDRYGIKKTNIRLIAEESGIARQTVYNYFKNKNELLSQAFQREGEKLGQAAAVHIERFEGAENKFIEAFLFIYENFPKNPILAKVIEPGGDFFSTIGVPDYQYATYGKLVFGQMFEEHPYLKPDADSIAELWIRGIMSFLTMPGPTIKTRDELREFVRCRFLPGLGLKNQQS
jgi:AcrR family transcriptional regulator